ncbi:MAG: hypothetical protein JXB88_25320 [Spirochaetales bacterium]|nr:hypothetical protein [Spirochaetales bacterium]
MKKVFMLSLLLCMFVYTPAGFSIDFGGYLDNTTLFSTNKNTGFYQIDRLSLWLSGNLGKGWSFSALGHYTFEMDYPVLFDIDKLFLAGKWPLIENGPSLFSVTMGRFRFSEFSNFVLDHPADGFRLDFSYPSSVLTFELGYTGLIAKNSTTITLSKADTNDQDDPDVLFGTPRLIGLLQYHLPEVMKGQDLYFSALFQKDLRSEDQIIEEEEIKEPLNENKGGYYDSLYGGAGLSGSLIPSLFYNVFSYFQTGRTLSSFKDDNLYQYAPVIGYLGGMELQYYSTELLYSTFGLSFIYSTGDEDSSSCIEGNMEGPSFLFTPISQTEEHVIFNPKLGNIFYIRGKYTIKPLSMLGKGITDKILVILDGIVFFRSTTGPITDQDKLNPDSESLYLGSEIDFIINIRPFSDLGMRLSTGYFIPDNGPDGFYLNSRAFEFLGKFELSFSF